MYGSPASCGLVDDAVAVVVAAVAPGAVEVHPPAGEQLGRQQARRSCTGRSEPVALASSVLSPKRIRDDRRVDSVVFGVFRDVRRETPGAV